MHHPPPPPFFPIPVVALTISVFSLLILWVKRPRFSFDFWFLAFLSALSCLHLGHILGKKFGPSYFEFFHISKLLLGPLFYFYLRDLLGIGFKRAYGIHFIPYVFAIFVFWFLLWAEFSHGFEFFDFESRRNFMLVLSIVSLISLTFYSIRSYVVIKVAEKGNSNPVFESIEFNWFIFLIILVLLFVAYHSFSFFLYEHFANQYSIHLPSIKGFDVLIFTIGFALFGVRQSYLHSAWLLGQSHISQTPAKKKKYEKSGLEIGKLTNYIHAISDLMETKKPYLNSEFTLDQLAEHLKIPRAHITQALNEVAGTNFYSYVNEFRIKEFILNLEALDMEKPNFLSLAYQVGFNSKSTFNEAFKRITGRTPSVYISEKNEKK
ncbi:MAG: AraC family transcriptional regulator [Leptospira sp.]|nr:AraC family transcriptional regulator [Leptospira sp.]